MTTGSDRPQGVVGVVLRNGQLLVIRRSAHVIAPGKYCFPGGGIHVGETEEQSLVRELFEELAVVAVPVHRLWQSRTPWNVVLAWWQVEFAPDATICPNAAEVESVHWLTPDEMASLPELLESNRHFLDRLRCGDIRLSVRTLRVP
jgi:8-oxo-dGTP diphosphatase